MALVESKGMLKIPPPPAVVPLPLVKGGVTPFHAHFIVTEKWMQN